LTPRQRYHRGSALQRPVDAGGLALSMIAVGGALGVPQYRTRRTRGRNTALLR
jgi:hypothetical protein